MKLNNQIKEYFSVHLSVDSQFLIVLAIEKIMKIPPVVYWCAIKT